MHELTLADRTYNFFAIFRFSTRNPPIQLLPHIPLQETDLIDLYFHQKFSAPRFDKWRVPQVGEMPGEASSSPLPSSPSPTFNTIVVDEMQIESSSPTSPTYRTHIFPTTVPSNASFSFNPPTIPFSATDFSATLTTFIRVRWKSINRFVRWCSRDYLYKECRVRRNIGKEKWTLNDLSGGRNRTPSQNRAPSFLRLKYEENTDFSTYPYRSRVNLEM
jgi:hypothetical protein